MGLGDGDGAVVGVGDGGGVRVGVGVGDEGGGDGGADVAGGLGGAEGLGAVPEGAGPVAVAVAPGVAFPFPLEVGSVGLGVRTAAGLLVAVGEAPGPTVQPGRAPRHPASTKAIPATRHVPRAARPTIDLPE